MEIAVGTLISERPYRDRLPGWSGSLTLLDSDAIHEALLGTVAKNPVIGIKHRGFTVERVMRRFRWHDINGKGEVGESVTGSDDR